MVNYWLQTGAHSLRCNTNPWSWSLNRANMGNLFHPWLSEHIQKPKGFPAYQIKLHIVSVWIWRHRSVNAFRNGAPGNNTASAEVSGNANCHGRREHLRIHPFSAQRDSTHPTSLRWPPTSRRKRSPLGLATPRLHVDAKNRQESSILSLA